MKKQLVFLASLSLALAYAGILHGARVFKISDGSKHYTATLSVEKCDETNCEGKGTIRLEDRKTKRLFQTLTSDDLYFFLDAKSKPTVNIVELYNEQSPLIFDDFNFDGTEDIAVRNGNNSQYSGPSYDVYVYHATKKKFVKSDELTALASENLGMFQVDRGRKRLVTYAKSGCCWHLSVEYSVVPGRGLVKVHELEEDAQDGQFVTVTTRDLVNGRWVTKAKKHRIDEYYKK